MEVLDIVIVGGGISGLATALALHRGRAKRIPHRRILLPCSLSFLCDGSATMSYVCLEGLRASKGIGSVVLERSETLNTTGAGIAILANGWRALDVLGIASKLRSSALFIQRVLDIDLLSGKQQGVPVSIGEARAVKRSDLIKVLADELPLGTVRFGHEVLSLRWEPTDSSPVLHLSNGSSIRSKILIGCDGANSVVADFLGIKPAKIFSSAAVRGFTYYPNGHGFAPEFVRIRNDNVLSGRTPVNNHLVFWFVVNKYPDDSKVSKDPELIRQFALESISGFPADRIELVSSCDLSSLSLTHLRYRSPWDMLLGKFHRGSVTVAGDAMHVMGPFLGQGGSAGIEDSVVLARCLSKKLLNLSLGQSGNQMMMVKEIGESFEQFVKERRMRLVWLSTQTYLIGSLLESSSMLMKIVLVVLLFALFRNPTYHTAYDCLGL